MNLGWRKTWDDDDNDFIYCGDSGEMIGRIYYSPQGQWRWFFAGSTGRTDSRREAMLAVEEAYEAVKG